MTDRPTEELHKAAKDLAVMDGHRESFKKSILESGQLSKFMETQFVNMLSYMENNEKLIAELSARLREKESRISELERVVIDGRMYADKIADDWEKSAEWLDKKSYTPPSSLILIREMLTHIFKETEQVLPAPPKKEP